MAADQSEMGLSFLDNLAKKCSVSTQTTVLVANTTKAPSPKDHTAYAATGSMAHTTFRMMSLVPIPLVRCGEVLICSVLLNMLYSRFGGFTLSQRRFSQSEILYQRYVRWTNIRKGTTLEAIHQVVLLGHFVISFKFGKEAQFVGCKRNRASF